MKAIPLVTLAAAALFAALPGRADAVADVGSATVQETPSGVPSIPEPTLALMLGLLGVCLLLRRR